MTNLPETDVAAALDGDSDALARLVERVRTPVFRLALRFSAIAPMPRTPARRR